MAALNWQIATVTAIRDETPRVKTYSLLMPGWQGHKPGQHVDVRLTAEDGYQAQRSYSIASAPTDQPMIDLSVERVEDGEISPFLHDSWRSAIASRSAGRSVATSCGTAPRPNPLLWLAVGRASCR